MGGNNFNYALGTKRRHYPDLAIKVEIYFIKKGDSSIHLVNMAGGINFLRVFKAE